MAPVGLTDSEHHAVTYFRGLPRDTEPQGQEALFAQSICYCPRPVAHLDSVPIWLEVGFPLQGGNEDTVKSHPSECQCGQCSRKWPKALPTAQVLRDRKKLHLPGTVVFPQSSTSLHFIYTTP